MKRTVLSFLLLLAPATAQLTPGAPAPALHFTQLLQAPAGTQTDWPSLQGKVVVLEFWATWCIPCVAAIPHLNALQATLDPAKIQFLSINEEDPAVARLFLKRKPISGWLAFEPAGTMQRNFGIASIPATIIVGPDGNIASTTATPESLSKDQLLALANGTPSPPQATPATSPTPAPAEAPEPPNLAILEIVLSPGVDNAGSRNQFEGPGHFDLTNLTAVGLLHNALDIPDSRIAAPPELLHKKYDLHVDAPTLSPAQLHQAIEAAIAAALNLHIEHHTALTASYILTATPQAAQHFKAAPSGFAIYQPKIETLTCRSADPTKIAAALEQILATPVVDESALQGAATATLKLPPHDLPAAQATLIKELGLTLTPAARPIETYTLTAAPTK